MVSQKKTKLNMNCENEDHFKHLVKIRTICNKHYENEDKKCNVLAGNYYLKINKK